jgi:hypothetical protein
MKRGLLILLLGLLACVATFLGAYQAGIASHREMLHAPVPELAWLKKEFHLSDAEFSRIAELHAAYQPQCQQHCQIIEAQNEKLQQLLATNTSGNAGNRNAARRTRRHTAECGTAMLKHFLEVSRAMPPEQGRHYLAW